MHHVLKTYFLLPALALIAAAPALHARSARTSHAPDSTASAKTEKSANGDLTKKAAEYDPAKATQITATDETTFDQKTHTVVFKGSVVVTDPRFSLTCDQLTAVLNTDSAAQKPAPSKNKKDEEKPLGSGIDHLTAEGHVVIIQKKTGTAGKGTDQYIGRSKKAVYTAKTGDIILSGFPSVQQGINMQIATSASTVMIMNRNTGKMKTKGPSKTVIQESSSKQ